MSSAKTYANPPEVNWNPVEEIKPSCILPIERFDHRRGLTSLQIHKTICSHDGRIWSATPAGLACYDGVKINMYGQRHGLSNHGLRTIAVHPDNSIWIGTDVGIEVLDISGTEIKVLWSNPVGTVNSIDVTDEIAVIGTTKGLYFVSGKGEIRRSKVPELGHAVIASVLIASDQSIWAIGPAIGIVRIAKTGEKLNVPQRRRLSGAPRCLAHGPEGSVLVGSELGVLNVEPDAQIIEFYPIDQAIFALCYADRKIFASTGKALIRIDMDQQVSQSYDVLHQDVAARHILVDHFDNIWISTGDQSLLRINGISRTLSGNYDLDIGHILGVSNSSKGTMIGGSRGLRLENGSVILEGLAVWDALTDEYGKVWCATNQGLYCMVNPNFTIPYRHAESDVVAAPCRALCFYKGALYASSIRGLAKIGPQGPEEILDHEENSLGYVYSLHVGPKGRLWIATLGRGLWRIDGSKLTRMFENQLPDKVNVYALCHSDSESVFVAHDGNISTIDAQGKCALLIDSGEPIAAWSIQCLPGDRLVAGSSSGLTIYDATSGEVHSQLSGNFDDVPWEFTTSRSLAVIDDNTVYCGLGSGLRTVHLKELAQLNILPSATLSYVHWRGVKPSKDKRGGQIVKTGNWHLEIGIRTCWYLDECVMRERLLGFEEEWSPFHALQAAKYTALKPGTYSLEVEVRSQLQGVGPTNTVFSFTVK